MLDVLTTLIVGCGSIAGDYDDETVLNGPVLTHAGAYKAHGGFELKACVEPDKETRDAFMAKWGVEYGFSDLAECQNSGLEFDVVSLCAPSAFHDEILQALLKMSVRAVFAEKPLTGNPDLSQSIVRAYAKAELPLAVNYFRRWAPRIIRLKHEIASGKWGEFQGAFGYYSKGIFNCGSHMIDLLQYLTGPVKVEDVFGSVIHDFSRDDPTLSMRLSSKSGQPIVIFGTDSRKYFNFDVVLQFEKGEICLEDLGLSIRERKPGLHTLFSSQTVLGAGVSMKTGLDRAMVEAVSNILNNLNRGDPLISDGQSALEAETVCSEVFKRHVEYLENIKEK